MAAADAQKQPIIVKRVVKKAAGHHGGSWKVAFADFATAMMAFFLLLWVIGQTTEEQKGAISEYFQNPSMVIGTSPRPSADAAQGPGGASTSLIELGGAMELYAEDGAEAEEMAIDPELAAGLAEDLDKERLKELMEKLQESIQQSEALNPYKDQILLDTVPEGLRIQIIDQENRPMFDVGSAELLGYSASILREVAAIIATVPNRISISGHTDARPYLRLNYSNWELSADRANAARRALLEGGLDADRVGRVVGLAYTVPADEDDPMSPANRRITIIVMNQSTEQAIRQEAGSLLSMDKPAEAQVPAE